MPYDGNDEFSDEDFTPAALESVKPRLKPKKHPYDDLIEQAAAENDLDPELIRAVMSTESSNNPSAVSPKGASGLMQLMPGTAARFGVTDIHDPKQNIAGGAKYLRWLNDRFKGDLPKTLAGYNAGEGAVDKYNGIPPYKETQDYVKVITNRYKGTGRRVSEFTDADFVPSEPATQETGTTPLSTTPVSPAVAPAMTRPRYAGQPMDPNAPAQTDPITATYDPRQAAVRTLGSKIKGGRPDTAGAASATPQEAESRTATFTPGQAYVEAYSEDEQAGATRQRVEGIQHTVKKGDSVRSVARKYGVKPADLLKANGVTDPSEADQLQPGAVIQVPRAIPSTADRVRIAAAARKTKVNRPSDIPAGIRAEFPKHLAYWLGMKPDEFMALSSEQKRLVARGVVNLVTANKAAGGTIPQNPGYYRKQLGVGSASNGYQKTGNPALDSVFSSETNAAIDPTNSPSRPMIDRRPNKPEFDFARPNVATRMASEQAARTRPDIVNRVKSGESIDKIVQEQIEVRGRERQDLRQRLRDEIRQEQRGLAEQGGQSPQGFSPQAAMGVDIDAEAERRAQEIEDEQLRAASIRSQYTSKDRVGIDIMTQEYRRKGPGVERGTMVGLTQGHDYILDVLAGAARLIGGQGEGVEGEPFWGEAFARKLNRMSQSDRDAIERAALESPPTSVESAFTFVSSLPATVLTTIAATESGGTIGGFAALNLLESVGQNESTSKILMKTAKGAATGGLFKATGAMPFFPRVGTVASGSFAIEKVFDSTDKDASHTAVSNALFSALGSVAKLRAIPGEVLESKGYERHVIRDRETGKAGVVYVNPESGLAVSRPTGNVKGAVDVESGTFDAIVGKGVRATRLTPKGEAEAPETSAPNSRQLGAADPGKHYDSEGQRFGEQANAPLASESEVRMIHDKETKKNYIVLPGETGVGGLRVIDENGVESTTYPEAISEGQAPVPESSGRRDTIERKYEGEEERMSQRRVEERMTPGTPAANEATFNYFNEALRDIGGSAEKGKDSDNYWITLPGGREVFVNGIDEFSKRARYEIQKHEFYAPKGKAPEPSAEAIEREKTLPPSGTDIATKENAGGVVPKQLSEPERQDLINRVFEADLTDFEEAYDNAIKAGVAPKEIVEAMPNFEQLKKQAKVEADLISRGVPEAKKPDSNVPKNVPSSVQSKPSKQETKPEKAEKLDTGVVTGFTTSKGSTYEVGEKGTIRFKKATGKQYEESGQTVYVSRQTANDVQSAMQVTSMATGGSPAGVILRNETDNQLYVVDRSKSGEIVGTPTILEYETSPKVGLHPIEIGGKVGVHVGHPITEIRTGNQKPKAEASVSTPAPKAEIRAPEPEAAVKDAEKRAGIKFTTPPEVTPEGDLILYHGTSQARWESIQKGGKIQPGWTFGSDAVSQQRGSVQAVGFGDIDKAFNSSMGASQKDTGKQIHGVVLKVRIKPSEIIGGNASHAEIYTGEMSSDRVIAVSKGMGQRPSGADDWESVATQPNAKEKDAKLPEDEVTVLGEETDAQESRATEDVGRGEAFRESRPPQGSTVEGEKTTLRSGKQRVEVTYVVREISDVYQSHHHITFQPMADFDGVNEREYNEVDRYQTDVMDASSPDLFSARGVLDNSDTIDGGPTLIDSDGNALGGNSRVMIVKRIYDATNPAMREAYRALLMKDAVHVFGLDPNKIASMKQPILVRELTDQTLSAEDKQKLIADLNKSVTRPLTAKEKAMSTAKNISPGTLEFIIHKIDDMEPGSSLIDALNKSGNEIVNRLIEDRVFSAADSNTLLDNGEVTAQGKLQLTEMFRGLVFRDLDQMKNASKSTAQVVDRIAPSVLLTSANPDWSILDPLREAFDLLQDAKAAGASGRAVDFEDFLRQGTLTQAEDWSDDVVNLARSLRKNPTAAASDFKKYSNEHQKAMDGNSLFPTMEPRDAFDVFFGDKVIGDGSEIRELHAGFPFLRKLFSGRSRNVSVNAALESESAEVERRWNEAKGIQTPGMIRKAKEALVDLKNAFKRHFPHLDADKDAQTAAVVNVLLQYEASPAWATAVALDNIAEISGPLDRKAMDLFTRNLVLPDILKDIEAGLYETQVSDTVARYDKELPYGYESRAQIERDLKKFQAALKNNPAIRAALGRRATVVRELTQKLIDLQLLNAEEAADPRYYHRQVMARIDDPITGTPNRDARMKTKGFQISRVGGGDFNTLYQEAEFGWMQDALNLIAQRETLDRLDEIANIRPQLMKQAELLGASALPSAKKEWDDLIPETHTTWQPKKGNDFFLSANAREAMLDRSILGELSGADARELSPGGMFDNAWVIPKELALTLDEFQPPAKTDPLERLWTGAIATWKQWKLLNPFGILKYKFNNMSGDNDIALAYSPKIGTVYQFAAARDLWRYHVTDKASPELKAEIQDAIRKGVLNSGMTITEIPEINKQGAFQALTSKDPNLAQQLVQQYWGATKNFNTWSENILRLAAYRYFKTRTAKGDHVYAASSRKQIDAIDDPSDKAARLATDLIGNYGNISVAGMWLRSHLAPFWSFQEINSPRYVRLFANLPYEGGADGERDGAGRAARAAAVAGKRVAMKAPKLFLYMHILTAMTALWNHLMFPDEEKELRKEGRKNHIILGRTKNGDISSIRAEGALMDALSWGGLEDWPADVRDLMSGRATFQDKASEAVKAPLEKFVNMVEPFSKTAMEVTMGKSAYPRIFEPGSSFKIKTRPIRDRAEYAAQVVSLERVYRLVTGKPAPPSAIDGVPASIASLLVYRTDPGEAAYWDIRETVSKFREAKGKESPGMEPTDKSTALYYFKSAVKWGDEKAAKKWLEEYVRLGGTPEGMEKSTKLGHPLGSMAKKDWKEFLDDLNARDQETLEQALEWYDKTYGSMAEMPMSIKEIESKAKQAEKKDKEKKKPTPKKATSQTFKNYDIEPRPRATP